MDRGEVTSLILLDLSAAFDTVDHSILLTRLQNWFGLDGLSLAWFTSYLSSRSQAVSINDSISAFSSLSCGVPQGSVLGPTTFYSLYYSSFARYLKKIPSNIILYADDTQLYISFTPTNSALSLTHLPPLSLTFSPGWILNKLLLNHQKLNFFSLAQNNTSQIFWFLLTYLSAMISSQSVPLLAILASSLTLTCLSWSNQICIQILSFSYPRHPFEFVIFFLFLQLQLLQIHLSPANLTTVIHYTLASHKSISTNFNAFQTHWHASSQTPQNTNTSHQYSKTTLASNQTKNWFTNSVFSHTKHLQINNQHIFTIVFHFLHILVSTRSSDSLVSFHSICSIINCKRLSLSSVPRLWNSLPPDTRNCLLYHIPFPLKHTSSKLLSLPRLFPISLDCLPGFWFLLFSFMPYRMTPSVRHRAIEVYYYYYYY